MKTVIFTSDKHAWLLKGFFCQWQKYAGRMKSVAQMEVAGFSPIPTLPSVVDFYSIGAFKDYPVNKWSDGVIRYLKHINDELVIILLEDYWLVRPVYWEGVLAAWDYMMSHPKAVRFDLTSDRVFSEEMQYVDNHGPIDICHSKGQYSLSFQAGIWRRELLLELMRPNESPWQAELQGSARLNDTNYAVFGSFQWPMNYAIVMNKGVLDKEGAWMQPARTLKRADWRDLQELGYLESGNEH